jgi:putative Ca2+/H+ antiporter (TMEM165/GDT1 family)
MKAFWLSLFLIFVAEMGDKSQLVALTLATRFKAGVVYPCFGDHLALSFHNRF